MRELRLATGLIVRDGAVLLVASRYPNQVEALWGLPGGRQRRGELLGDTVVRELREEAGMQGRVVDLAYVSESYDPATESHVVNATFAVDSEDRPTRPLRDAHVVDIAWVPIADVARRIAVGVVRDPLVAHLAGESRRYFGFLDAGISIEFSDDA